jgi:hypothetical protein
MNGIHDMSGMQDMGPIRREHDEPTFHAEWERRAFALFNAVPDVNWPYLREALHRGDGMTDTVCSGQQRWS